MTDARVENPESIKLEDLLVVRSPFEGVDDESMSFFVNSVGARVDSDLDVIILSALARGAITEAERDSAMDLPDSGKAMFAARVEFDPASMMKRLEQAILKSGRLQSLQLDGEVVTSFDEIPGGKRIGAVLAAHATLFPVEDGAEERTPYANLAAKVLVESADYGLIEEKEVDELVAAVEGAKLDGSSYNIDTKILELISAVERLKKRKERLRTGLQLGLVSEDQMDGLMNGSGVDSALIDSFAISVKGWSEEIQSIMRICMKRRGAVKDDIATILV